VTYYRKDILEKFGFPSEPEELGKYIEDPNNWLNMAKELKKYDHWIAQWITEPSDIYYRNRGFYDNKFNYLRKGPEAEMVLYASKIMKEYELYPSINIWEPSGQEAIRNGKICMVYLGSWGEKRLLEWALN
jgi:multiple sugar transport system substrate-binding protein